MPTFIRTKARLFNDRDTSTDPEMPLPDWPLRLASFFVSPFAHAGMVFALAYPPPGAAGFEVPTPTDERIVVQQPNAHPAGLRRLFPVHGCQRAATHPAVARLADKRTS